MENNGHIWVEKYRPTNLNDIVLDSVNSKIFKNIVKYKCFPNLLLHGPPGTGKTTTIINLVNEYQKNVFNNKNIIINSNNNNLIMHLNASDERGIDTIRNQIYVFVNSKPLFDSNQLKFVVLDEVDHMTKTAQQALKYVIQNYKSNVRFCLMCNYLCKIDGGLQNEFIKIKFNSLPTKLVYNLLNKISELENLNLGEDNLINIQNLFGSDIRSMINYMQSNINFKLTKLKILNDDSIFELCNMFFTYSFNDADKIINHLFNLQTIYKISIKDISVNLFNNIILFEEKNYYLNITNEMREKIKKLCSNDFFTFAKKIIHSSCSNEIIYTNYFVFGFLNICSCICNG